MQTKPLRASVPVEETWRLEDLYPTQENWRAELTAISDGLEGLNQYLGRLHEGPTLLLACLEEEERLQERLTRAYLYASNAASTDGTSPALQQQIGLAGMQMAKAMATWARLRSELLALPDGLLERYYAEEGALAPHRAFLTDLMAEKAHSLTPEAEAALAAFQNLFDLPDRIFQRGTSADMRFAPAADSDGVQHPVTLFGHLMDTELSPDTTLRRNSWASLGAGMAGYQNLMAENLAARIRSNVVNARLRGYNSVFEMLLVGGDSGIRMMAGRDAIPPAVFENVLDVIQTELAPHMQRLARLRRRLLELDELYLCDVQAALPAGPAPTISFEQGARWIEGATNILGAEYQEIMHQALHDRWIDRADNHGRAGVAFCAPVPGGHPYIFSTWSSSLRSLFVLAHELGHAGHGALSLRHQRLNNARMGSFFSEAPSTLNELLLARHLRQESTDPNLHRRVILSLLATYHHNFITHLLEAELLRRLYRKAEADQPITAKLIGDETLDLLGRFWGDTVTLDEHARLNWMRQPHYYSGLYPYTYAVGLAGATVVAQSIDQEGESAAARWVEVLKSGSTLGSIEQFRTAGVDMTSPEPLRQAVAYVGSLVDELERLYA